MVSREEFLQQIDVPDLGLGQPLSVKPSTGRAAYLKMLQAPTQQVAQQGLRLPSDAVARWREQNPPEREAPFGDGILGNIFGVVDAGRSVIASTFKEVGDLVQGEGFSPRDWWKQVDDNILWSEILQDWGLETDNPMFDFAAGITLDVALDPLTYLFGIGAVSRAGRAGVTWERGAQMLKHSAGKWDEVARVATNAERGREASVMARELFDSAAAVAQKKALSAATPRALEEIGLHPGLGMFVPGTGRLGRWVGADRLLDAATSGRVSIARARQAARLSYSKSIWGVVDDSVVTHTQGTIRSLLSNVDEIAPASKFTTQQVLGRMAEIASGGRVLGMPDEMLTVAARLAAHTPVEAVKLGPWSGKIMRAVGTAPGSLARQLWRRPTDKGMNFLQSLEDAFSSGKSVQKLLNSANPEVTLYGLELKAASTDGWRTRSQLLGIYAPQVREQQQTARRLGISAEDAFDFFNLEVRQLDPQGKPIPGSVSTELRSHAKWGEFVNDEELLQLWVQNRAWWDEILMSANDMPGGSVPWLKQLQEDLYVARFTHPDYDEGLDGIFRIPGRGGPSPTKTRELKSGQEFRGVVLLSQAEHAQGWSIVEQVRHIAREQLGDSVQELWEGDLWNVMDRYLHVVADEVRRQTTMRSLENRGVAFRSAASWVQDEKQVLQNLMYDLTGRREIYFDRMFASLEEALDPAVAAELRVAELIELGGEALEAEAARFGVEVDFLEAALVTKIQKLVDELGSLKAAVAAGKAAKVDAGRFLEPWVKEVASLGYRREQIRRSLQAVELLRTRQGGTEIGGEALANISLALQGMETHLRAALYDVKSMAEYSESVGAANDLWKVLHGLIGAEDLAHSPSLQPWAELVGDLRGLIDEVDYDILDPMAFDQLPRWASQVQDQLTDISGYYKRMVRRQWGSGDPAHAGYWGIPDVWSPPPTVADAALAGGTEGQAFGAPAEFVRLFDEHGRPITGRRADPPPFKPPSGTSEPPPTPTGMPGGQGELFPETGGVAAGAKAEASAETMARQVSSRSLPDEFVYGEGSATITLSDEAAKSAADTLLEDGKFVALHEDAAALHADGVIELRGNQLAVSLRSWDDWLIMRDWVHGTVEEPFPELAEWVAWQGEAMLKASDDPEALMYMRQLVDEGSPIPAAKVDGAGHRGLEAVESGRAGRPYAEVDAENVPISFFDDIKEAGFDRPAGSREGDITDTLVSDIGRNGILEPIVVEYVAETGEMVVANGNHRLAAARRAGMNDVPVVVVKSHAPGTFSPSDVGMPIVKRPTGVADAAPVVERTGLEPNPNWRWETTEVSGSMDTRLAESLGQLPYEGLDHSQKRSGRSISRFYFYNDDPDMVMGVLRAMSDDIGTTDIQDIERLHSATFRQRERWMRIFRRKLIEEGMSDDQILAMRYWVAKAMKEETSVLPTPSKSKLYNELVSPEYNVGENTSKWGARKVKDALDHISPEDTAIGRKAAEDWVEMRRNLIANADPYETAPVHQPIPNRGTFMDKAMDGFDEAIEAELATRRAAETKAAGNTVDWGEKVSPEGRFALGRFAGGLQEGGEYYSPKITQKHVELLLLWSVGTEGTLKDVVRTLLDISNDAGFSPAQREKFSNLFMRELWEQGIDGVEAKVKGVTRRIDTNDPKGWVVSDVDEAARQVIDPARQVDEVVEQLKSIPPAKKVVFAGCSGKKCEVATGATVAAQDMYQGPLWKSLRGALLPVGPRHVNDVALKNEAFLGPILSGKYGVMHPEKQIAPYDQRLTKKLADELVNDENSVQEFADIVTELLRDAPGGIDGYLSGGKIYRQTFRRLLAAAEEADLIPPGAVRFSESPEGLGIGSQRANVHKWAWGKDGHPIKWKIKPKDKLGNQPPDIERTQAWVLQQPVEHFEPRDLSQVQVSDDIGGGVGQERELVTKWLWKDPEYMAAWREWAELDLQYKALWKGKDTPEQEFIREKRMRPLWGKIRRLGVIIEEEIWSGQFEPLVEAASKVKRRPPAGGVREPVETVGERFVGEVPANIRLGMLDAKVHATNGTEAWVSTEESGHQVVKLLRWSPKAAEEGFPPWQLAQVFGGEDVTTIQVVKKLDKKALSYPMPGLPKEPNLVERLIKEGWRVPGETVESGPSSMFRRPAVELDEAPVRLSTVGDDFDPDLIDGFDEAGDVVSPPKPPKPPRREIVDHTGTPLERFIIGTPYGDFVVGRTRGQKLRYTILDIPWGENKAHPAPMTPSELLDPIPEGPRGIRLQGRVVKDVDEAMWAIGEWARAKAKAERVSLSALQGSDNPRLRRVLEQLTGSSREGKALPSQGLVEEAYLLSESAQMFDEARVLMEKGMETEAHLALVEARYNQLVANQIKAGKAPWRIDEYQEYIRRFNSVRVVRGFQEAFTDSYAAQMGPSNAPFWGDGWNIAGSDEARLATWESLQGLHAATGDPKHFTQFLKQYDRFLNYWKAQAVSTTGFIARNGLGGAWMNAAIGQVDFGTTNKFAAMYWTAHKRGAGDELRGLELMIAELLQSGDKNLRVGLFGIKGVDINDLEVAQQVFHGGVFSGGQVITEVERGIPRRFVQEYHPGEKAVKYTPLSGASLDVVYNPFSTEFAPFRAIRTMNESMEVVLRGSLAFDVIKKGGTLNDALDEVYRLHFNYADLTPMERIARRVIPFWKWQRSVIPVLVDSIGREPQAWTRLYQVRGEMQLQSKQEGVVPDYFLEAMGVRLPWKINGYQSYWIPDLPFKDLLKLTKEPTSLTRMLAESAAPPVKTPLEIWAGKQFFADIPFSGRFQQVPGVYRNIPFLMQALGAIGKAEKNSQGEWKMRDQDLYLMDSWVPFLGRFRRLFPNEDRYSRRVASTIVSSVFGTQVRIVDEYERRNQILRNDRDFAEAWRDAIDLETRRR